MTCSTSPHPEQIADGQDRARAVGTGLSSPTGPASGSGPSGFDPSRFIEWLDREARLLDRHGANIAAPIIAETLRKVAFAMYLTIPRDSDGSPKGGDACGSVEDDSAVREAKSPNLRGREAASKARAKGVGDA